MDQITISVPRCVFCDQIGSIFFASPLSEVSIYALSHVERRHLRDRPTDVSIQQPWTWRRRARERRVDRAGVLADAQVLNAVQIAEHLARDYLSDADAA